MDGLMETNPGELPAPLTGLAGLLGLPTFLEARAQAEWLSLLSAPIWWRGELAGASSRPVLLVPGFFATESSLRPMLSWLRRLGFSAEIAPVGLNAWSGAYGAEVVAESARHMAEKSGRRVVIVGHSRGGQHGTVAAVRAPEAVEALVTLGSPLRVAHPSHFLTRIPVAGLRTFGRIVSDAGDRQAEVQYERDLLGPFPSEVLRVSVWSKSDGIVDWRVSMLPDARNVSVVGSHIGLAVNRRVYRALASILEELGGEA